MRILVCGGRDFQDQGTVERTLMEFPPEDSMLIEGGAMGADRLARIHAFRRQWMCICTFPAQWERHGKAAGARRNLRMLELGVPDLVIAFPGGKGTAHMVQIAKKAGVPVRVIE